MHHQSLAASRHRPTAPRTLVAVALVATAAILAACSGSPAPSTLVVVPTPAPSTTGASPDASAGSRPSSPAVVSIVEPESGAKLTGDSAHVVLSLAGATIVSATTTNITPDTGHIHLYVDNVLVSMNYGLEQDVPVHAGTYVIKAEFVAADHAPFSPRVWSAEVYFTVK
jgi:hypothetical protein